MHRSSSPLVLLMSIAAILTADANARSEEILESENAPLARLAGTTGTAVEFSGDGRLILTAGQNEVRIWDAQTFQSTTGPVRHGEKIVAASFSPDGKTILTAAETEARVWNVETGDTLHLLQHEAEVTTASFSPDASKILTGGGGTIRIWDAKSGEQSARLKYDWCLHSAEFAAAGEQILAVIRPATPDGVKWRRVSTRAYVWDAAGRERSGYTLNVGPEGLSTRPAALSPDGASRNADGRGALGLGYLLGPRHC